MTDSNYIVSIVCISYNHEDYIQETLDGFFKQKTDFPIEIIIHDDASTDQTANIIRQYAKKDNRVKAILRKKNIKSTGANISPIVMKKAQGKYIAFCEGDDYWTDPYKLQKQVDLLNANPQIDICSHKAIKFDERTKQNTGIAGDNGNIERIIPIEEVINKFGIISPMPSIMIRNKKLEDFKEMISGGVYGGHGIMQVLWGHPNGILYIPEPMSTYRVNSAGSVTKNILNKKEYFFKILIKRIESFELLDVYFKHEYKNVLSNKILEIKKSILRARQITFKDKVNFLRNNKTQISLFNTIALIIKGFISKFKFSLLLFYNNKREHK